MIEDQEYDFTSLEGLKLLLVFPEIDSYADQLKTAAEKLKFKSFLVQDEESATEAFNRFHHNLVIIDNRQKRLLDSKSLCESLRSVDKGKYSVIVAFLWSRTAEREEPIVDMYFSYGYDRIMVEADSLPIYMNELMMLGRSDVATRIKLSTYEVAYVALDEVENMVLITDNKLKIKYVNTSVMDILGYTDERIQGYLIYRLLDNNSAEIIRDKVTAKENVEESMTWKTIDGRSHSLTTKLIRFTSNGDYTEHYIFIIALPKSITSSIHDKTHVDTVALSFQTATTIKDIVKFLSKAQQVAQPFISDMIKEFKDKLRNLEYENTIFEQYRIKSLDNVTSNQVSSLIQYATAPTQEAKSILLGTSEAVTNTDIKIPRLNDSIQTQIGKILQNSLTWSFEIFQLERLTLRKALPHLGMNLFLKFRCQQLLKCDETTLANWLFVICVHYNNIPYHTNTHAADVMQATAFFLKTNRMKQLLDPMDEVCCLIAAVLHDIDHPGYTNMFLCNTSSDLATLYNDKSVLENHHAALGFKITLSDDRLNIFRGITKEEYRSLRQNIINLIMATDMSGHFDCLANFAEVVQKHTPLEELRTEKSKIMRMLIKCADVSNPARHVKHSTEWAVRITEELFRLNDEEKRRSVPTSQPLFDRTTCSVPKVQKGFINYIIEPTFNEWASFIQTPELLQHIRESYHYWDNKESRGIIYMHDVIKSQQQENMSNVEVKA